MTYERIPGRCRRCSLQAIAGPLLAVALLMAFAYPASSHGGEQANTDCPKNRKQDIHHCHSEFKGEEPFPNASALPPEKLEGVTLEGLTIAPEYRCSRYDRDDYPYPQSLEEKIIAAQGGIYSPYTGETFRSRRASTIEHIVALSEAHDSGMCAASAAEKSRLAQDLDNLTLASRELNREIKKAKDAAEWLPPRNRCWYVGRIIKVKRKYGLTVDRREAEALRKVIDGCK